MGLSQKAMLAAVERAQKQAIKKGSDPAAATCRGKLQFRRSRLNVDINKHLMLRQGAENLLRAAENKEVRQAVLLELSFVNSNLQCLKEELSDLNSSVETYQQDSKTPHIPLIAFGLKETKPLVFTDTFKEFIASHYREDPDLHLPAIQELTDIRQAVRTPQRSPSGLSLLYEYYNQLYYVERRFFPPERSLGIYFEWYDSLTGLPSCQRTAAFEKACVLFNIGALHSQLAARQDRRSPEGLQAAQDSYLQSAGVYRYILESFSHAPSRDLDAAVLELLAQTMLAQAAQCGLERRTLAERGAGLQQRLRLAVEAAHVSELYGHLREKMALASVSPEEAVPVSWLHLAHIKQVYYIGQAHRHFALGLLSQVAPLDKAAAESVRHSQLGGACILGVDLSSPRTLLQTQFLGKCHLQEAVEQQEECLRLYRMSRELQKRQTLLPALQMALLACQQQCHLVDDAADLDRPVQPPRIAASSEQRLAARPPPFGQYPVADLFRALGPIQCFSAHHHWSPPRPAAICRRDGEPLGFSLKQEAPVVVTEVATTGAAQRAGLKEGDYIVGMDGGDLRWSSHAELVQSIRHSGGQFTLMVVTPLRTPDQTAPSGGRSRSGRPTPSAGDAAAGCRSSWSLGSCDKAGSCSGVSACSPGGSQSGASGRRAHKPRRPLSWNPFKRSAAKQEKIQTYNSLVSR